MKDSIQKHLEIERDLEKEISEISEIIKSEENDAVKLDSIRAILNELAAEIVEARIMTVVDEVTGCVSQKFIKEFLKKEMMEAKRYDRDLSILILDIDFLKYINDNFGHVMGTHVIEQTANLIKEKARDADVVSRYGGDEFVVVCPETNTKGAEKLLGRIKKGVESHKFSKGLKVSLSVGISEYDKKTRSVDKFIDDADKELYRAKEHRVNVNLSENKELCK